MGGNEHGFWRTWPWHTTVFMWKLKRTRILLVNFGIPALKHMGWVGAFKMEMPHRPSGFSCRCFICPWFQFADLWIAPYFLVIGTRANTWKIAGKMRFISSQGSPCKDPLVKSHVIHAIYGFQGPLEYRRIGSKTAHDATGNTPRCPWELSKRLVRRHMWLAAHRSFVWCGRWF